MELTENPQSLEILPEVKLSNSLVGEGRFLDAMKPLEKLVASGTHRGYVYLAIGDICRQLSRENINYVDNAKKFYNLAIKLAQIEKDNQVIAASKSGLAWTAIREAQDAFNSLLDIDRSIIHKVLPRCVEPELTAFFILAEYCSCPTGNTPGWKDGRIIDERCVGGGCRKVPDS